MVAARWERVRAGAVTTDLSGCVPSPARIHLAIPSLRFSSNKNALRPYVRGALGFSWAFWILPIALRGRDSTKRISWGRLWDEMRLPTCAMSSSASAPSLPLTT